MARRTRDELEAENALLYRALEQYRRRSKRALSALDEFLEGDEEDEEALDEESNDEADDGEKD